MTAVTDAGFVPMRLGKVVAVGDRDHPSFCVVLEGVTGDERLPIWIGETEGFYLSAAVSGTEFGRPMSPQFAAGLLQALGGRVRQVRIDRLIEVGGGTAYGAAVEVEGPAGIALVDARPSDALNLGALFAAPIVAAREVIADAQASLAGDGRDAGLLRRALQAGQVTIRREPER
jgi:bifunctional DNase/RNase